MLIVKLEFFISIVVLMFFLSSKTLSRTPLQLKSTEVNILFSECAPTHSNGKLVTNSIYTGGGSNTINVFDCYYKKRTIERAEYPKGSGLYYMLNADTWYGGIINNDTLVSQSFGEIGSKNFLTVRSISDPSSVYFENAIAEIDYVLYASDTFSNSLFLNSYLSNDNRPHNPLGISIKESSYSWSYNYADDFILLEYEIKNIGENNIKDFYWGIIIRPMAGYIGSAPKRPDDDIGGFYRHSKSLNDCNNISDNFDIIWGADNDGNPIEGQFKNKVTNVLGDAIKSVTTVGGVMFLNDKNSSQLAGKTISYNWWFDEWDNISDLNFGPVKKENSRNLGQSGTGSPFGDDARYFLMSNGEVDYDQIYTSSIEQLDEVWNYPDQSYAKNISDGIGGAEHMLSVGPFDIPPGGVLKIPFAYVAGENFHTNPANGDNLIVNPDAYYANLDFSDLVTNAQWARWIYDNPGVDTDGDGDSGLFTVCILDSQLVDNVWKITSADTFWYRGDGVPDWKAAGPPPAPFVWLEPSLNSIKVRFNGSRSETEKDIFTRIADFEGYNIYLGRDERESSLSLVASYDKTNYDKFVYNSALETYIVEDIPMTIEEILCAYADSCNDDMFDPLFTSRSSPILINDSLIFFQKHSFNVETSDVTKVYPNARDPRLINIDSLVDDDYTDDGYFKYFEYEYTIKNLLSTVGYWVNVTAFDFGSPKSGLKALESSKTISIQNAFPLIHADDLSGERKQVYIYPNPYRIDAGYRSLGFEGRTEEDRPDYRVRELNFANLPPKCEIKIFSLDGDLIRHLSHDIPSSDPTFSHHQWNLITRNTQLIVSGLYYWTVEFPDGETQIGKLVVLM